MNRNLSKMWRSGVALLLVFSMVLGFVPVTAFATEVNDGDNDGTIHYVSLGASNTNGYGHRGYLPDAVYEDPLAASKADLNVYGYLRAPEGSYPFKVKEALAAATGKPVEVHQLALSSMRVEEVLYLLDDNFEPDTYMNWRFTGGQKWFEIAEPGGIPKLKEAYRNYIADADVITVDLGWNNFGVFAFNNIKSVLRSGNYWKFNEAELEQFKDFTDAINYEAVKALALSKLSENANLADSDLMDKLEKIADVLVYATLGACFNFDKVMEKIYELNPDAAVVVINVQNLADDLVVDYEGYMLELGDLYGEMIELVDVYRATTSPYADKFDFAAAGNDGDVTTFLDELIAWNGDPATIGQDMKDCFDMYDDGLYVRSIVEYMMVGQALSGLFAGVRDMAKEYGLSVFEDDDSYTYEFALDMSWLDGVDLGSLNLTNPSTDLEKYGAAVAKHLKNLRTENYDAYDYAFAAVMTSLTEQKAAVEAMLAELMAQLEQAKAGGAAEEVIAQIEAGIAQCEAGIAQLEAAITTIVPGAQLMFKEKLEAIHTTYVNTLNYAYGIVATIIQYAAKNNALKADSSTMENYGSASDLAMGYIVSSFMEGAEQKFYYELQKNGIQATGVTEDPQFTLDETLFADPAVQAVIALATRYDLGNSFFAHPNQEGCDQVRDAVMDALQNGCHGDEFAEEKAKAYLEFAYELLAEHFDEMAAFAYQYAQENGYIDDAVAAVDDLITALKAMGVEVESAIADLTAQLDALEKELAEKKAQLENAVGELKEELIAATAKLINKIAKIRAAIAEMKEAVAELREAVQKLSNVMETMIEEGLYGAIEFVQETLDEVAAALEKLVAAVSDKASAKLKELIASAKAQLNELYYNATHGEYTIAEDSHYVALGDSTAVGESYVELLAEELALISESEYSVTNLAEDGLMIQDALAILTENAEEIAKADLVTIGFGSNGFTNFMVENLMNQINGETVEFDWVTYVGEDGVAFVEEAKADLYERLVESGVSGEFNGINLTDLLALAVESYAYSFVAYTCSLPEVIDAVHELSPEALVVVVGMYNPLADVVIKLGEEELAIGEYLQYLVDAANVVAQANAMLTGDVIYVDVPAVQTNNNKTEMTVLQFISEFLYSKAANLNPNENGHAYITEQIWNALTITEEQKGLLGDVNGDGVVNHNDARLVLQYYVGVAKDLDLTVADVDGNGVINHNDARLILQFYVGIITVFPVEA